MMTERYITVNKEIYVCFIDYSEGFEQKSQRQIEWKFTHKYLDGKNISGPCKEATKLDLFFLDFVCC